MPRTKEAASVKAWRMEQLINDLAVGEKSVADLAAEFDVEEQSVRVFKLRHKADIEAKKADWANESGHIWSTRKANRLRVLTQRLEEIEDQIELLQDHARRETETIRNVDPDASEVLVNDRVYLKYVAEQRSLLREIADQTGQLFQRVPVAAPAVGGLPSGELVADEQGNLCVVPPPQL